MVHFAKLKNSELWKMVTEVKFDFVLKNGSSTASSLKIDDIRSSIKLLEDKLEVTANYDTMMETIPEETLEIASQMFIYLYTWSNTNVDFFKFLNKFINEQVLLYSGLQS